MTLNVLHILPSLNCSGACSRVAQLASELPKHGFGSRVLSVGGSGPMHDFFRDINVQNEVIESRLQNLSQSYRRLQSCTKRWRPDIVHVWSERHRELAPIAATLCHIRPSKLVVSYSSVPKRRSLRKRLFEAWLNHRATHCVVDSRESASYFRRTNSDVAAKTIHIPLAVVRPESSLSEHERDQLKDSWQIPHSARIIGTVGPLVSSKRIKDLIWACDLLKVIRDDVYLVIMGAGPYRRQLERYCRQVHITDRVRLVGEYSDAARLMGMFDCYWQASDENGSDQAVLEAMISQVPVVVTNTAAHRELVVPDQTGLMVTVGRRAEFARQTKRLLESPTLASALVTRAFEEVTSQHSVATMTEQFAALYAK